MRAPSYVYKNEAGDVYCGRTPDGTWELIGRPGQDVDTIDFPKGYDVDELVDETDGKRIKAQIKAGAPHTVADDDGPTKIKSVGGGS